MQTRTMKDPMETRPRLYHFEVQGGQVGHAFASVNAPNLESARIRMSALFPGSETYEIEEPPVSLYHQ
jgi:hypothetical protein